MSLTRGSLTRSLLTLQVLSLWSCTDDARRAFPPGSSSDGVAPESGPPDAAAAPVADAGAIARRCKQYSQTRLPFFGDLHTHTALSLDANLQGTRLRPADAYRFARGERVDLPPYDNAGRALRTTQLDRPLDFLAVSDHAEFLGLVTTCLTPGLSGYDSEACASYRDRPNNSFITFNGALAAPQGDARSLEPCSAANAYCGSAARSAWEETKQAAARAQDESDACTFSSLVGYEWSASPGTKNLHRNVIFRSDKVPELPFSYFDGNQEEELWDALDRDCKQSSGCEVLTIPHNSNLSAGLMFEPLDRQGRPFDRAYAERRARMEPLVEIFQHKGASECLPQMGADELCSFEVVPYNTLGSATLAGGAAPAPGMGDLILPGDFVRDALAQGLLLSKTLGVNPFSYGFIGSTDTHVATPGAVDERDFKGHGGAGQSARDLKPAALVDSAFFNPGGLAVLWAEENSRDALFLAMKRREAYATSGPRIVLRFFAGFGLPADLCAAPDFAQAGYARGVPMGGVLDGRAAAPGSAPTFALSALRDPGSARSAGVPLDRVQIIKGTISGGEIRYAVFDVKAGPAETTVDPSSCELKGSGADELCGTWSDPAFDPKEPAFYYARVLERPSCRWHAYACNGAGVNCADPTTIKPGFEACCGLLPRIQQERAWSSPVFYQPP